MAYDSADSAANNCHEGTIRDAPATAVRGKIGVCKKRKNAAGAGASGGKRPLNPDRMERKASREKRRREEVKMTVDITWKSVLGGSILSARLHRSSQNVTSVNIEVYA